MWEDGGNVFLALSNAKVGKLAPSLLIAQYLFPLILLLNLGPEINQTWRGTKSSSWALLGPLLSFYFIPLVHFFPLCTLVVLPTGEIRDSTDFCFVLGFLNLLPLTVFLGGDTDSQSKQLSGLAKITPPLGEGPGTQTLPLLFLLF